MRVGSAVSGRSFQQWMAWGLAGLLTAGPALADSNPSLFPVSVSTFSVIASSATPTGLAGVPPIFSSGTLAALASTTTVSVNAPLALPLGSTPTLSSVVIRSSSTVVEVSLSSPRPTVLETSGSVVSPSISTAPLHFQAPVSSATPVIPTISTASVQTLVTPIVAGAATAALSTASPVGSLTAAFPNLKGKQLTLDLREMDIVDVLKMLSRQYGVNMVLGKNVSGRVTVSLRNVDFWDALRTLLRSRDLAFAQNGDLLEIMTSADYEKTYGDSFGKRTEIRSFPLVALQASTAKIALEPFRSKVGSISVEEANNSLVIEETPATLAKLSGMIARMDQPRELRVFRLNYATAEEIQPKIASLVSKEYGNLQIDKRSNTVVVQDNPVRIKDIAEVIEAMDVRDKTVLIEAKIIQITFNKQVQRGVNWQGVNWSYIFNKLNGYHVAGTLVQNLQLVDPQTVSGSKVTAPGITAQIGVLEKSNFQAVINALDTIGTTNLLSSPRVMALNRQEAKIHVGSKVAKITKTLINAGSTTTAPITTENVEFLDVGVKLEVTPVISNENTITMKVKPEVSSVENTITTADGSSIPVIRISEAEASLVVKDGITVVLGGLMEDSRAKTDNDVPWLGRIPLLGALFRNRNQINSKTELVIFLTPHIVNGDLVSQDAQERFHLEPDGTPKKRGFFKRLFGK